MTIPTDQLKEEIGRAETRAHYSAWILLGGLGLEILFALIFPHGASKAETWLPVIATLLVAAGVYGEVHFAGRASIAQEKLRALAEVAVAEANARAAEASKKAKEAELKLEQLRRNVVRTIDRDAFLARLKECDTTGSVNIEYAFSAGDGYQFGRLIDRLLKEAGWSSWVNHEPLKEDHPHLKQHPSWSRQEDGREKSSGLVIWKAPEDMTLAPSHPATALQHALTVGLQTGLVAARDPTLRPGLVRLVIFPKP